MEKSHFPMQMLTHQTCKQKLCVKCGKDHGPIKEGNKCELEKAALKDIFCINCGQKGHPVSYPGCLYLITAQDLKRPFGCRNGNLIIKQLAIILKISFHYQEPGLKIDNPIGMILLTIGQCKKKTVTSLPISTETTRTLAITSHNEKDC
ncbi:Protein of unknown function [Cotesia congregata]|uniref:Uncharacterized protein n=1 Tax=Cotesia congregata TaxID=51543 RepID=A0A8J2MSL3_COTCN|nr:Protein of unknown function [Cotesia congregata]